MRMLESGDQGISSEKQDTSMARFDCNAFSAGASRKPQGKFNVKECKGRKKSWLPSNPIS
jgi:hypothetical protein